MPDPRGTSKEQTQVVKKKRELYPKRVGIMAGMSLCPRSQLCTIHSVMSPTAMSLLEHRDMVARIATVLALKQSMGRPMSHVVRISGLFSNSSSHVPLLNAYSSVSGLGPRKAIGLLPGIMY